MCTRVDIRVSGAYVGDVICDFVGVECFVSAFCLPAPSRPDLLEILFLGLHQESQLLSESDDCDASCSPHNRPFRKAPLQTHSHGGTSGNKEVQQDLPFPLSPVLCFCAPPT